MKKIAGNNSIPKQANNKTSQQMAEASHRLDFAENSKILSTLLDSIDTAICVTDELGYFIDVNNAYSILSGYKKDELIGNKYSMIAVAL
ncbi:MAG: PAS domain S-box protein, partial [Ferruginibacter sp.]|nr:PAS domain S-box protein [Ferruginibacter sp.]